MCTNNGYSRIYIYIAEIYNMHSNNIQWKIKYHLKKYFIKNNSVLHVQYNNNRIKTQIYNKSISFFWNSKKSFYFQIHWWIIVHLYNVIIVIRSSVILLLPLLKVALTSYSILSVALAWNGTTFSLREVTQIQKYQKRMKSEVPFFSLRHSIMLNP
jgi:hypothetical protein